MTPEQEQGYREEAERLAQLPREQQKAIIAMHRADSHNPKVPKRDREFAGQRVRALERFLGLAGKGKRKKKKR